jgi:hypothetical protein
VIGYVGGFVLNVRRMISMVALRKRQKCCCFAPSADDSFDEYEDDSRAPDTPLPTRLSDPFVRGRKIGLCQRSGLPYPLRIRHAVHIACSEASR